jgi:mRNA-degrading endonuclease RelE of RelBE toxin-antitoxin system
MKYTVYVTETAKEQLSSLPVDQLTQVLRNCQGLAADPRPPESEIEPFMEDGYYRIKVGDFHIVYEVDDTARTVLILQISAVLALLA